MKPKHLIVTHGDSFGGDCPKQWDLIHNYTGLYTMDAVIDFHPYSEYIQGKLDLYCCDSNAYCPGTGYNSYNGYSKDN
jgi:hypothetical protein